MEDTQNMVSDGGGGGKGEITGSFPLVQTVIWEIDA